SPSRGLVLLIRLLEHQSRGTDLKSVLPIQSDVLRGIQAALAGQRHVPMPEGWSELAVKLGKSPSGEIRDQTLLLSLLFGDPQAVAAARRIAQDSAATLTTRQKFLEALVYSKDPQVVRLLQELIGGSAGASPSRSSALRGWALRALAAFSDDATPKAILDHYAFFTEEEKSDAIHALASRPAYARALLDAVEHNNVPRRDISAFNVRQMIALQQKDI